MKNIATDAVITGVRLQEQANAPANPAAGYQVIYSKSDGLYIVDHAGTVTHLGAGGGSTPIYPDQAFILGNQVNCAVGGISLTHDEDSSQYLFGGMYTFTGAINNAWETSFLIKAGTYNFTHWGQRDASYAKVDYALDGVNFATGKDWYGAYAANFTQTGSFTVATSGRHLLRMTCSAKNASSSSYGIYITFWMIKPATFTKEP